MGYKEVKTLGQLIFFTKSSSTYYQPHLWR